MFKRNFSISLFLLIYAGQTFTALEIIPDFTKLDKVAYKKNHQNLLKQLLKSPVDFLKNNREQRAKFLKTTREKFGYSSIAEDSSDFEKNCDELYKDVEIQFPLVLLDECNESFCVNKRIGGEHSYIRAACETEIINEIKTAALKKNCEPVNYVNFGSADGFQDLLIVTQLLEQGIERINLHLIDPCYKYYIDAVQKGYSPKDINEYLYLKYTPFNQLSYWFAAMYPKSNCRLFVYKDVNDYKEFIQNNPKLTADVVFGIDFTRDYPAGLYMYDNFISLLQYVFLNNDKSVGFKDCGFCVLKFSIDEDLRNGFEILESKARKLEQIAAYPKEYESEPSWVKLLFNKTFCTTGKTIDYMPIADKSFKAQMKYWGGGS